MKLGSLFDGIGTFPLSGIKYGFMPVWASEIEAFPIAVTKHHFPDMKHLGDITKINGAEIEPVDVITFGSPCQDMSVAGKRAGLEGERSGLFMEAIRIIREMRITTGRKYPRFIIWENVPGAYSSNNGQDFRAVLEEIAEAEIPMPPSGKWAEAGMVRTERVDIAWRTLDAQYWGVPQRRRRIFLVADLGGQCAGEILFVEPRLPWNSKTSGEAGEETTGDVGDGVKSTVYGFIGKNSAKTRGIGIGENLSPTIDTTSNVQIAICPAIGFDNQTGQDVSYALDSLGNHAVCIGYAVRRLTPLECERLQGLPDGYTNIEGAKDTNRYKAIGNGIAKPCSDFVLGGIARVIEQRG